MVAPRLPVLVGVLALLGAAPASAATNGMLGFSFHAHDGTRQLGTINPDGSGRSLQPDGRERPIFSPDGNRMLAFGFNGIGGALLYVRNLDGSNETQLTVPGIPVTASWSPDGTRVAYELSVGGNAADAEIWTAKPDGSDQRRVTNDGFAKLLVAWGQTPSGPRIAYAGGRSLAPTDPCYGWQLTIVNPDGSSPTCVASAAAFGQNLAMGATSLAWSPDGTRLAFTSTYSDPGDPMACLPQGGSCVAEESIWVSDLVAGTTTRVHQAHGFGDLHAYSVTWSPDGTELAFAGEIPVDAGNGIAGYTHAGIYVMAPTGGPVTRVTPDIADGVTGGEYFDPSWQPCTSTTVRCLSTPPSHSLSVTVTGAGRVTSQPPGIDCPGSCLSAFPQGSQVTLTATGAGFHGWSGACAGTGPTCPVTLDADTNVAADFAATGATTTHTLGFSSSGRGRVLSEPAGIDCPGTCQASFADGVRVTLTATPEAKARLASWGNACAGTAGPACSLLIDADTSASAIFTTDTVAPVLKPASTTAGLVGSKVQVALSCVDAGGRSCAVRLTLRTRKAVKSGNRRLKLRLGTISISVPAGRSRVGTVTLSKTVRKLLTRRGAPSRVALLATGTVTDAAGNRAAFTFGLTLRRGALGCTAGKPPSRC
jgi:Tol biopolymer transport system component